MQKIVWYFKQLFPLRYESVYREDGQKMLTIWRMWFGRCFAIRNYQLTD